MAHVSTESQLRGSGFGAKPRRNSRRPHHSLQGLGFRPTPGGASFDNCSESDLVLQLLSRKSGNIIPISSPHNVLPYSPPTPSKKSF